MYDDYFDDTISIHALDRYAEDLMRIEGVKGMMRERGISIDIGEITTIYVLADEHGIIDRQKLFDVEDKIKEELKVIVSITVKALQGRTIEEVADNMVVVK